MKEQQMNLLYLANLLMSLHSTPSKGCTDQPLLVELSKHLSRRKSEPITYVHQLPSETRVIDYPFSDISCLGDGSIKTLMLKDCPNITDLSFVKDSSIEALYLVRCTGITDISALGYSNLKYLHIRSCPNITDLSSLDQGSLETLILLSCTGITRVFPLENSGIRYLDIRGTDVVDTCLLSSITVKAIKEYGAFSYPIRVKHHDDNTHISMVNEDIAFVVRQPIY